MKKIIASAVGLMLAGGIAATTASAAVENQFGGYWRSRIWIEDNFDGTDSATHDKADNRTRLYYTAKFSDDFKFVNKFEFNTTWGDNVGGDVAADGMGIWRIKNSYADFNMGPALNAKLGIHSVTIARGFIFADDFSGATLTGKFGNVTVPLVYIRVDDEDNDGATSTDVDQDIFAALATVKVSDAISVTPFFVYHTISGDADADNWYLGADADLKFGSVKTWGTAIYNGGTISDVDNAGFLVAAGADAGIVHGQAFYATGDDDATDEDNDAFIAPQLNASTQGASYYWSEIMGYGVFDDNVSNGAPGDDITNVWAANAGVTVKPMDKLSITADVWYASLVEDNENGDTELGVEFDGNVAYKIYDNLTAEAIFAYLIAGDATGDEDVIESGVRVSLSF